MKNAPSVSYPVGRTFWGVVPVVLVGLLWLLSIGTWWLTTNHDLAAHSMAGVMLVVWGFWIGWQLMGWRRTRPGRLAWIARQSTAVADTGTSGGSELLSNAWQWRPERESSVVLAGVRVIFDFQRVMLVQARRADTGKSLHFWLTQAHSASNWHAMREALVAHAQ